MRLELSAAFGGYGAASLGAGLVAKCRAHMQRYAAASGEGWEWSLCLLVDGARREYGVAGIEELRVSEAARSVDVNLVVGAPPEDGRKWDGLERAMQELAGVCASLPLPSTDRLQAQRMFENASAFVADGFPCS